MADIYFKKVKTVMGEYLSLKAVNNVQPGERSRLSLELAEYQAMAGDIGEPEKAENGMAEIRASLKQAGHIIHVQESGAAAVVSALLEYDEVPDPKAFAMRDRAVFNHQVWNVTTSDLRQVLRSLGWRATGAYRRKRGSVSVRAQRPVEPGTNEYGERDKLQGQIEAWLKQQFPDDQDYREIQIGVHVNNVAEYDANHYPIRHGDTYFADVEINKHDPEGNPYA